jgi:hypothetical protein
MSGGALSPKEREGLKGVESWGIRVSLVDAPSRGRRSAMACSMSLRAPAAAVGPRRVATISLCTALTEALPAAVP